MQNNKSSLFDLSIEFSPCWNYRNLVELACIKLCLVLLLLVNVHVPRPITKEHHRKKLLSRTVVPVVLSIVKAVKH